MAKKKKFIKREHEKVVESIQPNPSQTEQISQLTRQIEELQNNLITIAQQHQSTLQQERLLIQQLKQQNPLHEQLDERFVELAILTKELESKEQELNDSRELLAQAQTQLDEMQKVQLNLKRSLSWRITKPLRWVMKRKNSRQNALQAQPTPEERNKRIILSSGLFDRQWYLDNYPEVKESKMEPVIHFLTTGCSQGYRPNQSFDPAWYLSAYPDVRKAEFNPLVHYILHGKHEHRHTHA